MMAKGQETRHRIVAQAAPLFNQQGYSGTSLSDIMQATGLEKGGIYNHFGGKEQLALEAFDFAYQQMSDRFAQALRENRGSSARQLLAVIHVAARNYEEPPVAGGCPILNTAVESDDTHPLLKQRAREATDAWRQMIQRLVTKGIARNEFEPETDGDELATLLISALEGGLMLSKLYDDPIYLERVTNHLTMHVQSKLKQSKG